MTPPHISIKSQVIITHKELKKNCRGTPLLHFFKYETTAKLSVMLILQHPTTCTVTVKNVKM